jgi:hypothetical protein
MPASPRTAAGRALLGSHFVTLPFTEAVRHKRAAFVDAILAIEAEAAQKTAPLDVETALRVMDKLIEIHDCRDPDMGVPCSFHAREHRLLADVIYEEVARLAPAQARPTVTHEPNHYDWFMPANPTATVDEYLDDFEAKLREALTDPYVHDMAQSVLPLIAAYREARARPADAALRGGYDHQAVWTEERRAKAREDGRRGAKVRWKAQQPKPAEGEGA